MYLRLILHSGLGAPTSKDKTDSPTPEAYTSTLSGTGIATDAGAIVSYLHGCYKPPSLNVEDKKSITPFRWDLHLSNK